MVIPIGEMIDYPKPSFKGKESEFSSMKTFAQYLRHQEDKKKPKKIKKPKGKKKTDSDSEMDVDED